MPFSVGYVGYCQINVSKRAGNIEKMKLNQKFLKNILSIVLEILISLAPLVEIKNIIFLRKLPPMWTAMPPTWNDVVHVLSIGHPRIGQNGLLLILRL